MRESRPLKEDGRGISVRVMEKGGKTWLDSE